MYIFYDIIQPQVVDISAKSANFENLTGDNNVSLFCRVFSQYARGNETLMRVCTSAHTHTRAHTPRETVIISKPNPHRRARVQNNNNNNNDNNNNMNGAAERPIGGQAVEPLFLPLLFFF